jgi:hypothetical protein
MLLSSNTYTYGKIKFRKLDTKHQRGIPQTLFPLICDVSRICLRATGQNYLLFTKAKPLATTGIIASTCQQEQAALQLQKSHRCMLSRSQCPFQFWHHSNQYRIGMPDVYLTWALQLCLPSWRPTRFNCAYWRTIPWNTFIGREVIINLFRFHET